jgi:hypothetical protein
MPKGIGYAKAGKLSASGKKKISDAEKIRRGREVAESILRGEKKTTKKKVKKVKKKKAFRSEATKRTIRGLIKSGLSRAEAESKLDKGAR